MLIAIKFLHTAIWAVLGACVLAIPWMAVRRRFRWAAVLSAVVLVECAIIGLNGGRCPLTDWAARYTSDRAPNFDIYLPMWLAEYNKQIFGTLFLLGEVFAVFAWRRSRGVSVKVS